jgi:hypothetical protein
MVERRVVVDQTRKQGEGHSGYFWLTGNHLEGMTFRIFFQDIFG